MAIYPETVQALLADCQAYREGKLDLDTFKSMVWNASRVIVAVEERDLHRFLMSSEGELETIQFTTDSDKIFERTLSVVDSLERVLKENLEGGSGA